MKFSLTRHGLMALLALGTGCGQSGSHAINNQAELATAPPEAPNVPSQQRQQPDAPPNYGSSSAALISGAVLDAKLLVIAADGNEADLPAIKQALDYLGTPYTLWVASQHPGGLTADVLANGTHGAYQGVILTDGALVFYNGTSWASALTDAEWTTLSNYEVSFGVRQVNWYSFPTAALGFTGNVSGKDTMTSPVSAKLTAAGKTVFPYLNAANALALKNAWIYLAHPTVDANTTPLLVDSAGNAIALVEKYADGREWLTMTVDGNQYLTHTLALQYGLINWVTKGVFIGERHSYLAAQIDDLLLPSDIWGTTTEYRITPKDLDASLAWQNAKAGKELTKTMKLSWAFNGSGAYEDDPKDPLANDIKKQHDKFYWLNHTWTHPESLSVMTYADVLSEITLNNAFAKQMKLTPYLTTNMVTPGVSGLDMAASMQAIYDAGVRFVVSDTSRVGQDNPSPNAGILNSFQPSVFEIPRRPTNLFYNVWTPQQWAAEYNSIYHAYWGRDLTVAEIMDKETDMLVLYMLRWEIDPWMFHQANLGLYDGKHALLTDLLDAAIAKYSAIVTNPIISLPQEKIGAAMADKMALNASSVSGTITPGVSMTLTVKNAATVPVTGANAAGAETYAGQKISHVGLKAGQTMTVPLK